MNTVVDVVKSSSSHEQHLVVPRGRLLRKYSNEITTRNLMSSSSSSSPFMNSQILSKASMTSLNSKHGAGQDNEPAVDASQSAAKPIQLSAPQTLFTLKNQLLRELTRAIQLVQKCFLEKAEREPLTNSDYSVHELCQQFDFVFLLGLKKPEEGYWKLVLEFTHRNVISDLKSLLNVTTNFGRGRSWIYHALNDNLMESYLRCFLDDKRLVNRYYTKGASLITDEQALTVLVTLVAGLENVEFKLHNDVPYLDHSCWPTHLNIKRQVVDSLLNSSAQSLSQLIDLNASLAGDSANLSQRRATTTDPSAAEISRTRPKTLRQQVSRQQRKSRTANNISLENSTTSSVNNLSDANSMMNDLSIDYSVMSSTMPNETGFYVPAKFTADKRRRLKNIPKQAEKKVQSDDSNSGYDDRDPSVARMKSESISSSLEMDKLNTSTDDSHRLSVRERRSQSQIQPPVNFYQNNDEIENEIDRLKIENSRINRLKEDTAESANKPLMKSKSSSFSSTSTNQELAASSLHTSSHFDKKIQHIETYSQIIENATQNMDDCVKHLSSLYENYEKIYNDANVESDMMASVEENQPPKISIYDKTETSVYDEQEYPKEDKPTDILDSSSLTRPPSSLTRKNTGTNDETVSVGSSRVAEDRQSIDSSVSSKFTSRSSVIESTGNENDYLDDSNKSYEDDFRYELKTDNNTKLLLSIEIFQNGSNEEFVKLYQVTRGYSQGEIEAIFLMVTTYGIYLMTRLVVEPGSQSSTLDTNLKSKVNRTRFKKESFLNHNQLNYVEVSLGEQAFHLVCNNKRQNCWITTGSKNLTRDIMESLQVARSQNKQLVMSKISVFYEATQQKLALKKFISNEENLTPQDIEIRSYFLVFWEDQASQDTHLIHKEGPLYFHHKSSSTSSGSIDWKKGYFVLKNDVLTKYKTANDKRPTNVIKLNGEDFAGCRRNQSSSRPFTIELILSNSNVLYLSAKSESEATDWLQSFCKVISLGNYHTDVPSNSCLPCCAVVTNNRLYFCHEDLNTGFYRLLETIKLQEINRISFDNDNPFYCILHDDLDDKNNRYWYIYFTDKNERNNFITSFKEAWELLFQVPFTVEKCKSEDMRKRCIKGVRMIHKTWENIDDFD